MNYFQVSKTVRPVIWAMICDIDWGNQLAELWALYCVDDTSKKVYNLVLIKY